MKAFLDFEASSLSSHSHPIEVAWVFEDGVSESHLIRPAPTWTDWDMASQAIHGIGREELLERGSPVDFVASRMLDALSGHELFASAPSWDGKWLSFLLRTAGHARHALRLRDTDEAIRATATAMLGDTLASSGLDAAIDRILADAKSAKTDPSAHRALEDAMGERAIWLRGRAAALDILRGSP